MLTEFQKYVNIRQLKLLHFFIFVTFNVIFEKYLSSIRAY